MGWGRATVELRGAGSAAALHQRIKRDGGGVYLRNEDGRVRPSGWSLGELLPKNLHGNLPKATGMLVSLGGGRDGSAGRFKTGRETMLVWRAGVGGDKRRKGQPSLGHVRFPFLSSGARSG